MLSLNFINISDNSIYFDSSSLSYPILIRFLLEIYLKESDDFIYKLCFYSSVYKFFDTANLIDENLFFSFKKLRHFKPVKLQNFLNNSSKFCHIVSKKYASLVRLYNNKKLLSKAYFERKVNFVRYLDFFLFSFLTNVFYTRQLFRKYLFFIRSNLHFDIKDTKISLIKDESLFFLGFHIKAVDKTKKNFKFFSDIKRDQNFILNMLNRLKYYKKKNFKLAVNRINLELILCLNEKLKIIPKTFFKKKLWLSLFQQEAIRSARLGKLLFTSENLKLIPKYFCTDFKNLDSKNRLTYFFDSYILKMQFLVSSVLHNFKRSFDYQLVPVDSSFSHIFEQYEKSLFLFYNDLFLKNPFQPV
jgi:hypothetical protein